MYSLLREALSNFRVGTFPLSVMVSAARHTTRMLLLLILLMNSKVTYSQEFLNGGVVVFDCHFRLPEGYFLVVQNKVEADSLLWTGFDGGIRLRKYKEGEPVLDTDSSTMSATLVDEFVYKGLYVSEFTTKIIPVVVITDKKHTIMFIYGNDSSRWREFIDNCFSSVLESYEIIHNKLNK